MAFPADRSRRQIERVLEQELARLQARPRLLHDLGRLRVATSPPPLHRVAVVAADAGNLELRLHPLRIGVVQVATSDSRQALGTAFVPLSAPLDEQVAWVFAEHSLAMLAETARNCGLDPEQAQRWLPELPSNRSLDFLREFLEWLLLVYSAQHAKAGTLLLRDGLLRTIVLPRPTFEAIRAALQSATDANGVLLCALAKRLPGGDEFVHYIDLAVSAALRGGSEPAAFEIPPEVEKDFSPAAFASAHGRRAGVLSLLALTGRQRHRPLAVEIPVWQRDRAPEILGTLAHVASDGYPEPGHPPELLRAHLAARISPLQREYLGRGFLARLVEVRGDLRERLLAAHLLGAGVVSSPGPMEESR